MAEKMSILNTRPGWREMQTPAVSRGGVAGFLSWASLQDTLKKSGLLKEGEYVSRFEVGPDGVTYFIEKE